jgi:ADP-ribosylglycohydrolase
MPASPTTADRIRGCLLGGALGDALGASIEFDSLATIRRQHGPAGLTEPTGPMGITDDTQMTLFTAEGLLRSLNRQAEKGIVHPPTMVWLAYRRWLVTQDESPPARASSLPDANDGWMLDQPELWAVRAPGTTCLSALRGNRAGAVDEPINDSKGCGGIMRVAPVAFVLANPFELGNDTAALTHSHPSGFLSTGAFAVVLRAVVDGRSIDDGIDAALDALRRYADPLDRPDAARETISAVEAALDLADREPSATPEAVETLGEGWVGEEALAITLYCSLTAESLTAGVVAAVNHSGDSDSTGALVGNLLGARDGQAALPAGWLDHLIEREVVAMVADDLIAHLVHNVRDLDRYPP